MTKKKQKPKMCIYDATRTCCLCCCDCVWDPTLKEKLEKQGES